MSKTRLRSILVFALAIMLLLASCQQAVTDPQEPESLELNETIAAPAQPEPEELEPATMPTQIEQPATQTDDQLEEPREPVRIWEPWETQDMEWPELFAAMVERFGEEERNRDFFYDQWGGTPTWFALMDIDGDGQPEFLFGSPAKNITGIFVVFSASDAEQFLLTEIEDWWDRPHIIFGDRPLRFFVDENSGEQMFSAVASRGPIYTRSIFYTDVQTLNMRWAVSCSVNEIDGKHRHGLSVWCADEQRWTTLETLESSPLDVPQWSGGADWPCDIWHGRGSADYTVVTLVNMALEGFTDIPTPAIHEFPGEFGWDNPFGAEQVESMQDWIFKVAEQWG